MGVLECVPVSSIRNCRPNLNLIPIILDYILYSDEQSRCECMKINCVSRIFKRSTRIPNNFGHLRIVVKIKLKLYECPKNFLQSIVKAATKAMYL